MRFLLFIVLLVFFTPVYFLSAQSHEKALISEITMKGNERTKNTSVLRELDIAPGDSIKIDELSVILGRNRNRLFNTGLFYDVSLSWLPDSSVSESRGDILILFKEYGLVSFGTRVELADRNFNIWWQEKNHLLDRLNFRLSSRLNNVDGKNQRIELVTQLGYTEQVALSQQIPFINKEKTLGLSWFVLASRNRELNYNTLLDKQVFQVDPGNFLFTRISGGLALHYRNQHIWRHRLDLRYHHLRINDYVNDTLNPDFFLGKKTQLYEELHYTLVFENRDRLLFPVKGNYAELSLQKRGVFLNDDVDLLFLGIEYQEYMPINSHWSYAALAKGRLAIQRTYPGYFQYRALGERNNFLRGYELFVMEGLDYGFLKQSVRRRILDTQVQWLNWLPFNRYKNISLEAYATANLDAGYVHEPFLQTNNTFTNQWLIGGGFGLDVVVMGDMLFRFELSSNQKALTGVYLHIKFGIHPRLSP